MLRLGAGGVAAGLAGCSLPATDSPRGPTPEPGTAAPSDRSDDFEPNDPPMETPWTSDVDPSNPRPEYPRPRLTRERWLGLNGVWGFQPAAEGESPPFGERLAERILVPFPVESALSGVQREESRVWYRRTFSVPDEWDERVLLHFEAVDFEATVYVDGREVTTHEGGYDPFAVDVTDALAAGGGSEGGDGSGDGGAGSAGAGGEHELVVGVVDPTDDGQQPLGKQRDEPGGIYYTSCSGVWGSVWLEPVPDPHVTTLDADPEPANEQVRLTVETDAANGDPDGVTVRATAVEDGDEVGTVTGSPGEELALPVPEPRLWRPEDPFLYDLRVELLVDDEVVDTVGSYVGMRSVGVETVDGARRFTLNGEPVFHVGTLDQGFWPDGVYTAPTDEALRADLEAHVDLGFNAVRKHVKVEPRRWYYHADRLGLLVWQDMPASAVRAELPRESARDQFETGLRRMVSELDSHPSVVAWVPFNEGWGTFDVPRIVEAIREVDPTRPIDAQSGIDVCEGADRICGPRGAGDVLDYHNYPGPGSVPAGDGQAAVLGEYGGVGLTVEDHLWNPDREYSYASASDGAELTDSYVKKLAGVRAMATGCGSLAAAFYTQLTDVEREVNGLYTYDRQVLKPDAERVRQAHEDLFAAVDRGRGSAGSDATTTGEEADPAGVGYWPLDEGERSVVPDRVGDHDAQFQDMLGEGPQWTDGKVGGAVAFDGDHDVLDTGASVVDTDGPFGAAAWVRLEAAGTDRVAVSQDGADGSAFALAYRDGPGRFAFAVGGAAAVGGPAVETDRWYHVAGTVGGCVARLYVDGEQVASTPAGSNAAGTDGRTVVGRGRAGGIETGYWDGRIDEVHVYERELTAADVRRLVDQG
ncbi:MAG: LamG-like jellyroll fold domain-containing protein [Halosimplex sp.]